MTRPIGSVVSSLDLPLCELNAARLDGELFALDESFLPVDTVELPVHRAQALALRLPARLIAELGTAAWVLGASDAPPVPLEVCSNAAARFRAVGNPTLIVREVVLGEHDTITIGRLTVTSPLRTAVDLARARPRFDTRDAESVRRLAHSGGFSLETALDYLDQRGHLPAKRRAFQRLTDSLQPLATRYTS